MNQVLLINDDEDICNRTAAMLHEMGWDVRIADTDKAAFESLVVHRPMLVFVDIEMEGDAGFAAISTVRRLFRSLFVIAVTRGADAEHWSQVAIACGANHYVAGPISPTKLATAIQYGVEKRLVPI